MVRIGDGNSSDTFYPMLSRRLDRRGLLRFAARAALVGPPVLGSILSGCSDTEETEAEEVLESTIDPFEEVTPEPQPTVDQSEEVAANASDTVSPNPAASPDNPGADLETEATVRPPDELLTWFSVNTDWAIRGNAAEMVSQHEEGRLLLDTGVVDHAIEATMELPAGDGEHYAGLYVRYEDEQNFVHARYLEQLGNSEIEVFQRWNGEIRLIIFINFHQSVNGTTRRMRLTAKGSQVAVYDGDELVGQGVTDLNGTVVGLGAFGDQPPVGVVPWTDVTVSTASGGEVEPPETDLLFHGQFLDDDIPPPELPRTANPGPGEWIIDQQEQRYELRHETLRVTRAESWNDPQFWTSSAFSPQELGALSAVVRVEGATHGAGVFLSTTNAPDEPNLNARGLCATTTEFMVANSWILMRPAGEKPDVSNRSVDHLMSVVPRPGGGSFLLVSGGRYSRFPEASLLWVEASGLDDDLYAGLGTAPNTNVSLDDVRVIARADLPEGFDSRFGIATVADDFGPGDGGPDAGLQGRSTSVGGVTWEVPRGAEAVSVSDGRLRFSNSFSAMVESPPGARMLDATFSLEGDGSSFGLIIRADAPGAGAVYFGYLRPQNAWAIWGQEGELIWSTHAGESVIGPDVDIRLSVIDDGQYVQLFANDTSLTGSSWLEVSPGRDTSWVGTFSEGDAAGSVAEFAVWPTRVMLGEAFDALREPPEADQPLAMDDFSAPDGTDLDHRAATRSASRNLRELGIRPA